MSPTEILSDARLDRSLGGPSLDVYRDPDGGGEHYGLVYPTEVNYLAASGDWRKLAFALTEEGAGWEATSGSSTSPSRTPSRTRQASPSRSPRGRFPRPRSGSPGDVVGVRDGQAVTFADAYPDTDLVYTLTAAGYAEDVVLKTPKAAPPLAWDVVASGLKLAPGEAGEIQILASDGSVVGMIPTPVVRDAAVPSTETVGVFSLSSHPDGSYRITLSIDPTFLATATYPATIDPANATLYALRDTYVNSGSPGSSYEGNSLLRVGSGKRTFVRFDIEDLKKDDRLVYQADAFLYKVSGTGGDIVAKRVVDPWPSTMTWNNQPGTGMQVDDHQTAPGNGWLYWELAHLYQNYIQTDADNHWVERGFRLSTPDPVEYEFYSSEPQPNYPVPPSASTLRRYLYDPAKAQIGAELLLEFYGDVGAAILRSMLLAMEDDSAGTFSELLSLRGLGDLASNTWFTARFIANVPATTAGWAWAETHGGDCTFHGQYTVGCYGHAIRVRSSVRNNGRKRIHDGQATLERWRTAIVSRA